MIREKLEFLNSDIEEILLNNNYNISKVADIFKNELKLSKKEIIDNLLSNKSIGFIKPDFLNSKLAYKDSDKDKIVDILKTKLIYLQTVDFTKLNSKQTKKTISQYDLIDNYYDKESNYLIDNLKKFTVEKVFKALLQETLDNLKSKK